MARSSRTLWQLLVLANVLCLATLQRTGNAQSTTTGSSTLTLVATSVTAPVMPSMTPSMTSSMTPSMTLTPAPTMPPNPCRKFNGTLNPCGLKPDQLYYYTNDKSESEFLQNMAIISTLTSVTDDNTANCGARLAQFACHYLFPRCNSMMMPMAPCQNYCICTLQDTCAEQWVLIAGTIEDQFGNYTSNFTELIDEISARGGDCDNLDFYRDQVTYDAMCDDFLECMYPTVDPPSPSSSPSSSSPLSESFLAIILGSVLGTVSLLFIIVCFVFCCCCVCHQKNSKMSDAFLFHKHTADYLQSGDSSILRLARIQKRKSKFKSPRELLKQVPPLYSELMLRNAEYLIQESRIHSTSFLAEGTFSEVYLGNIIDLQPYDTSTFRSVVVKQLKDGTSDADILRYLEMCLALGSVSHPNVMTIIGVSFNSIGSFSMIYPYLEEHDLLTYLRKKRSNIASGKELQDFSVDVLAQMVFQICQGMRAISRMRIVYKTLCAHACMVNIDQKQRQVIIGDVSFSKLRDFSEKESRCTSPHSRWLAPESILDGEFTEKSDVWSFGITCWEVFSFGSQPFADMDHSTSPSQKKLVSPSFCPDSLFAIIQGCWNKNEKERPSFADLLVRLDTLLARTSYQQEVAEINGEIHSGVRRISPLKTLSTSEQRQVFEPASTRRADNLETSLKTSDGYLKVIGDQADHTADGYLCFPSSNKYENNPCMPPSPLVDIGGDEDPYGYVNVTPEPVSQTTPVVHVHDTVPSKPVTNVRNSGSVSDFVYDNLGVVPSPTSTNESNQSKATKPLIQQDAEFCLKEDFDKAKKPAPLPKPSHSAGKINKPSTSEASLSVHNPKKI